MSEYGDKLYVATTISREHPAYLELAFMDNRAEFVRRLLEDTYKVCSSFGGYESMPEEERLRTYFGVGPSEKEQRKKLLEEIAGMMADEAVRRKLVLEAAYMSLWQCYKDMYRGKDRNDFVLAQYFVSYYAGVKEKEMRQGEVTSHYFRCSFHDALMDFVRSCPPDGRSRREKWEDYAKSMPGAEKLYIRLCLDWALIHDNEVDTEITLPKNAFRYITGFMERYLKYEVHVGYNIHTAFLKEVKEDIAMTREAEVETARRKAG